MNPRREKAQQAENKTSNGETPVCNKKREKTVQELTPKAQETAINQGEMSVRSRV
jgi:hypothetical protein